jgi:hypothetical protein
MGSATHGQHGRGRAAHRPEARRLLAPAAGPRRDVERGRGRAIGRALTPEGAEGLLETAASNPDWEHVYCAAVLAANTSMRGVEFNHDRRKNVDLEKVRDVESATGNGVLYVWTSKNEASTRNIALKAAARNAITRMLKRSNELAYTDVTDAGGVDRPRLPGPGLVFEVSRASCITAVRQLDPPKIVG